MSHEHGSRATATQRGQGGADTRATAPGKRPLTMGMAAQPARNPAPVQARHDPTATAARDGHASLTDQWMDTAVRPDLHGAPVQRAAAPASATGSQVVQMNKAAVYDTDTSANPAGALGSRQPYSSNVTPLTDTMVTFGSLNADGCGTSMEAIILDPSDIPQGGPPSVRPPWWPSPSSTWWSNNLVQGHLLNHNIGGPGDDMRNLAPITKTANSDHLRNVEKAIKSAVTTNAAKMYYKVDVDYSSAPTLADIPLPDNQHLIGKFPAGFECDWATYDSQGALIDNDGYSVVNKK